jgi:hypothetical protein
MVAPRSDRDNATQIEHINRCELVNRSDVVAELAFIILTPALGCTGAENRTCVSPACSDRHNTAAIAQADHIDRCQLVVICVAAIAEAAAALDSPAFHCPAIK